MDTPVLHAVVLKKNELTKHQSKEIIFIKYALNYAEKKSNMYMYKRLQILWR